MVFFRLSFLATMCPIMKTSWKTWIIHTIRHKAVILQIPPPLRIAISSK